MSRDEVRLLTVQLPCDRTAPRLARARVGTLDTVEPVLDDVLLVTSELVSNAVLHAGCGPDEEIECIIERVRQGVRVTVSDPGHGATEPHIRSEEPDVSGGMGLRVVETLACRWGFYRDRKQSVWAELAL